MLRAYHAIGLDTADLFRVRDGRITEQALVQKGQDLYERITQSGHLLAPATHTEEVHSRQFHLDRMVGDDQFVFLSFGRRYWNDPQSVNFGYIFDAEQLLRQGAILRTKDLMGSYDDLLEEVVRQFAPDIREDQFTPEQLTRMFQALDDPNDTTYVSPNDAYYTLHDAVEYQNNPDVPFVQEATQEFLRRAKEIQSQFSLVAEEAIQAIAKEGETGRYEILVQNELSLSQCIGRIEEGKEYYT